MAGSALTGSASGIGAATRRRLQVDPPAQLVHVSDFGSVAILDGVRGALASPDTF